MPDPNTERPMTAQLRQRIAESFSLADLRSLCDDLDVNHEQLHTPTLDDFADDVLPCPTIWVNGA